MTLASFHHRRKKVLFSFFTCLYHLWYITWLVVIFKRVSIYIRQSSQLYIAEGDELKTLRLHSASNEQQKQRRRRKLYSLRIYRLQTTSIICSMHWFWFLHLLTRADDRLYKFPFFNKVTNGFGLIEPVSNIYTPRSIQWLELMWCVVHFVFFFCSHHSSRRGRWLDVWPNWISVPYRQRHGAPFTQVTWLQLMVSECDIIPINGVEHHFQRSCR